MDLLTQKTFDLCSWQVLVEAGVISGNDMTVEAALTKLSYVLGHDELILEEKKKVKNYQVISMFNCCFTSALTL